MSFIWWLFIGLIAGWLAKLVVPGREPGGFLATLAIGVVGAVIGGWIWNAFAGPGNYWGSFPVAFVGSVILLVLYHAMTGSRSRV